MSNDSTSVDLFYTVAFPPAARLHLEALLSSAESHLHFRPSYDAAFDGLSPANLFKHFHSSLSRHSYALIADRRTLSELSGPNTVPTVIVASAHSTTSQEDWDRYKIDGPGDLSLLHEPVRWALLRAMCEERLTQDPRTDGWFHASPRDYSLTSIMWQIKTVRADLAGASYACRVYATNNINDMHALFSDEAAKTGGVFRGI
ncbi:hypothetical protein C8J57DRAFT_1463473 [Mycena rebaudengoi]|nr:hypothetical protein C8J57DRAFT_1463473 [Mycena rebaudengoi]